MNCCPASAEFFEYWRNAEPLFVEGSFEEFARRGFLGCRSRFDTGGKTLGSFNLYGSKWMTSKRSLIALAAATVLATGVAIASPAWAAGPEVNATITGLAL